MAESRVTFLLPAFNEADSIGRVLGHLQDMEVLVVDDGSNDDTAAVAKSYGVRVLSLGSNQGYDGALIQGLIWCKREGRNLVVTSDADGQHSPNDLWALAFALERGELLVIGVRDNLPRFGERVMAAYGKLRFGISDPLCGLKGYDLSAMDSKDIHGMLGSVGSGLAFSMARRGAKFSQHSVTISPRLSGPSRFGSGLRANGRILKALNREVWKDIKNLKKLALVRENRD